MSRRKKFIQYSVQKMRLVYAGRMTQPSEFCTMTSFCVTHLYFFLSPRQTDNFHPMISQSYRNLSPHTTAGSRHHGDFPLPSFHGEIDNTNQLFRRVKILFYLYFPMRSAFYVHVPFQLKRRALLNYLIRRRKAGAIYSRIA